MAVPFDGMPTNGYNKGICSEDAATGAVAP